MNTIPPKGKKQNERKVIHLCDLVWKSMAHAFVFFITWKLLYSTFLKLEVVTDNLINYHRNWKEELEVYR